MQFEDPPVQEEPDSVLPLINVVFLLLIFFMMFGAIQAADFFSVEPPDSASGAEESLRSDIVLISPDGRLAFDDEVLDEVGLQLKVTDRLEENPGALIQLKADGRVAAARVVEVMGLLEAVGVERLLLLTLEPNS